MRWKLDRFARNRCDSARYKATLKKNGVKAVSATEVISDGAEGIILESVLEGYAEYCSADLSEKVVRGMTENALKSKYNGGTLPIGYMTSSTEFFAFHSVLIYLLHDFWRCQTASALGINVRNIQRSHDVIRGADRPGGVSGLGNPLIILVPHVCLRPQAEPESQQKWRINQQ